MQISFFTLVLAFLVLNLISLTSSKKILNSTTDRNALLAFKAAVKDPNGVLSGSWSVNTPVCHWNGVSCAVKHERVAAINLSGFNLGGIIPPHFGNLTFLRYFDISSNNFTGSVPSELANLRRLKEINLGFNMFTGEIGSWFGAFSRLQRINLRDNGFSGRIPGVIFINMSVLMEIDLRNNELGGELPNDTCRNTPELRRIYLTGNLVRGRIPASISNCRMLEDLRLSRNQFSGSIPSEIGNLSMLKSLVLPSNQLQGIIPASIFNISSLEYVDISSNRLSGSLPTPGSLPKLEELYLSNNSMIGSIPKEIGYLSSLKCLGLSINNLTGHIPKQVGNLTQLTMLNLAYNKLEGALPEELGNVARLEEFRVPFNDFLSNSIPSSIFNLSNLKILALHQNQFSGSLPPDMGRCISNLEELYLYWNKLTGEIPASLNNASKLTHLELNNNSFTGSVPDFGNLRRLQVVRLWMNNLTGAESPAQELRFISSLTNSPDLNTLEISYNPVMNGVLPNSVGNLSSLARFMASDCNITGDVPSTIGNLNRLGALDLSNNRLGGFIPTRIGELKQLQELYLYGNQLEGYIPHDLCQMRKLGNLYLSDNMLVGSIPKCLGEVTTLKEVSFASNNLNSTLPSNLFNLKDLITLDLSSNKLSGQLPHQIGSLKAINLLNLSSNKFSGYIPSSIDGCQSLEFLNLSSNVFNGSIPESLGQIKGLTELDLSNNNLSGLIDKSFEKLNLKKFNVSYNQLEGEIPEEGCFGNFTSQSFLNNSGLCGATRFLVQPCVRNEGGSRSKSFKIVTRYVIPSSIAVMFLFVGIVVHIKRHKKVPNISYDFSTPGATWKLVSEREIKMGTDNFSDVNLLGRGSIGSVFKATLSDQTNVAVKVFNLQEEGATDYFKTECQTLSTIRHRNLVKILGCCSSTVTEFEALILAYMPNGSLDKWLHCEDQFLDLMQRVNVAIDVALALEYLHHHHTFVVVHCDIKPNNVLLDEDMTAHVGDFSIAKLFKDGEVVAQTLTMATIGYAAPEYGAEGKVSTSGDVYSYGILLLEVFTSKRPTDDMFDEEMSIKNWVEKVLQEDAVNEIVAPHLLPREDRHFSAKLECVSSIFYLAMKCLAFVPHERLNMIQVVSVLQKMKAKLIALYQ